jgi:hypothetical protein
MDETIKKIKMFAIQDYGNGFVSLLGEFDNYEDIKISCGDFEKDVVIEFEEYYLGGDM